MCMNVCICMNKNHAPRSLCSLQHHPDAASLPPYPFSGPTVTTQTRSDQNNTSVTASILCPGALWKRATFSCRAMKALLNSHSTKPCMSAVQSPAPSPCLSVSKPSGDLGLDHKGMSFLPNHLMLDDRSLDVRFVGKLAMSFPSCDTLMLYTSSLILLPRFDL